MKRGRGGRNAKDVEKERTERSTSKLKLFLTIHEGAGDILYFYGGDYENYRLEGRDIM